MLPLWIQWPQALLIVFISCIGAWIAYQQVHIARARFNLDLYERRFKIFSTAKNFLEKITISLAPTAEDVLEFKFGVADSVFLFEDEITAYLQTLTERGARLQAQQAMLKGMPVTDPRRGPLIDAMAPLESDLATEYERLVERFKPYLKLKNIR
jgi:hypothetical protein